MSTVRLRRLQADYDRLQEYTRRHPRVKLLRAEGEPPERYQIQYRLKSLRQVDDDVVSVLDHTVEIVLPGSYPRLPPQCRMLTPIFHPNIAPHAICIGDHWSAGEPLWNIVVRIGEMIAYQAYNLKSPLNGAAARWVDEHLDELPLDPVSMLAEEGGAGKAPPPMALSAPRPAAAAPTPVAPLSGMKVAPVAAPPPPVAVPTAPIVVTCQSCGAGLKVGAQHVGKRVRCPKCQAIMVVPG